MQTYIPIRYFFKIYVSLAAFFLVLLIGTVGYMLIEQYTFIEAVYMTVITLSTVGFTEVHPLDDAGRVFTIILILANVGVFTYFITQLSTYFMDGEFMQTYKHYKMNHAINQLQHHVILCGFGRSGKEAAKIFHNNHTPFVVVETQEQFKNEVNFSVPFYVQKDATHDDSLIEAGIANAAVLVTTLPQDADNLFVVLTARALSPSIKIISRAAHHTSVQKLKTAGANHVIMPDKIGGAHMAAVAINPDVREFVELMATQHSEQWNISEILCNKTISLAELNCWKNTGATLLGIKTTSGELYVNPTQEKILQAGSFLIVMGSNEQLSKLKKLIS